MRVRHCRSEQAPHGLDACRFEQPIALLAITGDCRPRRKNITLRFLANLDHVPFGVADLEKRGVAIALNGSGENAATGKVLVGFL
jgi:hypothetical protein